MNAAFHWEIGGRSYETAVSEKQEWESLKEKVRYKSAIVSTCKNEQTDKDFDDAIAELMDFEKSHGIEEN